MLIRDPNSKVGIFSDLQLGDKKITSKHLVFAHISQICSDVTACQKVWYWHLQTLSFPMCVSKQFKRNLTRLGVDRFQTQASWWFQAAQLESMAQISHHFLQFSLDDNAKKDL